jgi:hypothetical protein
VHKGYTYLFFYNIDDGTLNFAKAKNNTNDNFIAGQIKVDNSPIKGTDNSYDLLAACSMNSVVRLSRETVL